MAQMIPHTPYFLVTSWLPEAQRFITARQPKIVSNSL